MAITSKGSSRFFIRSKKTELLLLQGLSGKFLGA